MKYNKINEFLVKEAFKVHQSDIRYYQEAEFTFLCIDGCYCLKIPAGAVYVNIEKIVCDTRKELTREMVDKLFSGTASSDLLRSTNELFQVPKIKKTCNVFYTSNNEKILIDSNLLRFFDNATFYTKGPKSAVYIKENDYSNDFCGIVLPVIA